MNKKKLGAFVAIGASLLLMAGCGNGGSASSDKEKKEIVFWNPFTGGDSEYVKNMVDSYNKTNPEYKIKNVSLQQGDMYTKIPTIVNSGKNIPDLNIVHAERIVQFQSNDLLEPLDNQLTDFPEINGDNYVKEAWNIGDVEGERYSVPLDIINIGTYYNKELVDKYLPGAIDDNIITFDEIEQIGEKAKADDIATVGYTVPRQQFFSLLSQQGGSLTEDGTTPILNTEQSKKTVEKWADLYKSGYTQKEGEDALQLFLSGKLVFFPEGIWIQSQVREAKFDWGLINSPQLSDDLSKAVNFANSHQFVMLKNDNRTDEKEKGIMEFLEWIRTNSLEWANAGQNPASLEFLNNEDYKNMKQSMFMTNPEEQGTLQIFDYRYNGYVTEYLDKYLNDAVFGKVNSDDFVNSMQKEVQDKINKDSTNK